MSRTVLVVVFAFGISIFATGAQARGGGSEEFMDYVADTTVPVEQTGGAQVSLCHLIKKHTIVMIPFFYDSEGYVLAPNRCDSEKYFLLTAEELTQAQAAGMIPADVPDEPAVSFSRRIP